LPNGQHEPSARCTTETVIGDGGNGVKHGSRWAARDDGPGVRLGGGLGLRRRVVIARCEQRQRQDEHREARTSGGHATRAS
jgi:uncharacterized protein (DUF2252 family)